jgi:hypothetical protein
MTAFIQTPPSPRRVWLARGIAVIADLIQLTLFPVTSEGVFSPVADGIDIVMAVLMTLLVGWNIAFIPSFFVKLTPFVDLAPTWTIAVLFATRGAANPSAGVKTIESKVID